MKEFITRAKVSIDTDVPMGYEVNVDEAFILVDLALDFLKELDEKYAENKKATKTAFYEDIRLKEEEKNRVRETRQVLKMSIDKWKSEGYSWRTGALKRHQDIKKAEKELQELPLYPEDYYATYKYFTEPKFLPEYTEEYKDQQIHNLNEIVRALHVVVSETVPLNRDDAVLLSDIKTGAFQKLWEYKFKDSYGEVQ